MKHGKMDTNCGTCRFDCLSIFINFMFFSSVFFSVEHENDIRFLEKSIIKISFTFKVNFSLFNTEETKNLIIPILSSIVRAQIAELIYVIPFQTYLTFPFF